MSQGKRIAQIWSLKAAKATNCGHVVGFQGPGPGPGDVEKL